MLFGYDPTMCTVNATYDNEPINKQYLNTYTYPFTSGEILSADCPFGVGSNDSANVSLVCVPEQGYEFVQFEYWSDADETWHDFGYYNDDSNVYSVSTPLGRDPNTVYKFRVICAPLNV